MKNIVELGDEVKDKVSGFQGVADARFTYLQGCNRIQVQPPVKKDGKLPDSKVFDEPLLEVMNEGRVAQVLDKPDGGPKDHVSISR
ncbi:hypothetical protein LCGC14_1119690 [marine sediment metagenome]|uniref:Uncharacterized protein n=1 Tax=marine sediment metagenome TaxID=412755 RepID=A0A0F9QA16_9ZZZZ